MRSRSTGSDKGSPGHVSPAETEFRPRSHEVSRIEAFSDVVFGFSLTLLVVSLEVPHTFTDLLVDMRGFIPFAVCFAIFALVWWQHHNFFRRYGLDDGITATLNFVLLFVMLFYTYPLKFLFTGMFGQMAGATDTAGKAVPWIEPQQSSTLMIVYGMGYATVYLVFVLLYCNALRQRKELDLNRLEVFDTYTTMMESGLQAGLGVSCALLSAILPTNRTGLAGFIFFLIPAGMSLIGMTRGKARRGLIAEMQHIHSK
jgi:uncharacterized membrane protein